MDAHFSSSSGSSYPFDPGSNRAQQPGLRPLLPSSAPRVMKGPVHLPPKRRTISLACETCRRRKKKCNGRRPRCEHCITQGVECIYRELPNDVIKRKFDQIEDSSTVLELFRAVQSRPEAEAADIFKRIRSGADPAAIMRHLSAADLLLQLQLKPETRYRFEFPYRTQMPASLRFPGNPYLRSLVYECTYLHDWNPDAATALIMGPLGERRQTPYLKPLHAALVVDPRLEEVTPSKWTSVSADDGLMRTLLQAYFLHEYSYFTFFQKDYFLDDMLAGEDDLCSSMLVNAVLAVGCHCHPGLSDRAEFWNPQTLGYRFLAEANRIWEEKHAQRHTITFVQATLVINILYNISGMDKLGLRYLSEAASIAQDMGMFDSSADIGDVRLRNARDFTAWCLFWWQSMVSFHFMTVPLVSEPPRTPPPDPDEDPGWYGELWLKYHLNESLVPMSFGHVQKAKLELLLIASKATLAFSGRDEAELREHGAEKIRDVLQELGGWYAALPEPLVPQKIVFPSQLKVHLHYHNISIQLYEFLVARPDAIMASISSGNEDPRTALARSRAYFETLLRLYYLRHGFERADMMMTQFLSLLAITSLDQLRDLGSSSSTRPDATLNDVRSTLIMAEKGLGDQGKIYYFPQTMFHIVQSRAEREESGLILRYAEVKEEELLSRQMRAMHMQSQYPVPTTSERQSMGNWMQQYARLGREDAPGEEGS